MESNPRKILILCVESCVRIIIFSHIIFRISWRLTEVVRPQTNLSCHVVHENEMKTLKFVTYGKEKRSLGEKTC